MKIDSATVDKINQANLANILKKVKAGKVLTAQEQKAIAENKQDEEVDKKTPLFTARQMTEALDVTAGRITQLKNDCVLVPVGSKYDAIASMRAYVKKLRDKQKDIITFEGVPDIDESKARKEAAQAGLAELKLAEEKMEVVRIAEIDTRDAKIGAAVRAATMKRRSELPPILEGLSANQIAAILDERDRDFLEMLADQQSEFWERREKLKAAMENE
jgi:Spy/CpxP family protein refolding chaperone